MSNAEDSNSTCYESKFKSLKSKHGILKDAFKRLHADYENVKSELASKAKLYDALSEHKDNIQQAYDNLTQEVIEIQKQSGLLNSPDSVLAQGYNTLGADTGALYTEISSLKHQLENASAHNDLAQAEVQQLRKSLESKEVEYGAAVAELKERILVLESLLKDCQEQGNRNEIKIEKYTLENKELKDDFKRIRDENSILKVKLDTQEQNFLNFKTIYESRLDEQCKFDLRRYPELNRNNCYIQYDIFDWEIVLCPNDKAQQRLLEALGTLFQYWNNSMEYIAAPNIVTDSALKSPYGNCSCSVDLHNDIVGQRLLTLRLEIKSALGQLVEIIGVNLDANDHSQVILKCQNYIDHSCLNKLAVQFKRFIKLLRIYMVVEDYIYSYKHGDALESATGATGYHRDGNTAAASGIIDDFASTAPSVSSTRTLIRCLSCLYSTCSAIYTRLYCYKDDLKELKMLQALPRVTDFSSGVDSFVSCDAKHTCSATTTHQVLREYATSFIESLKLLKASLSHRLCYPKFLNDSFFPLTGATAEMLSLVHSVETLTNLVQEQYLPHLYHRCMNVPNAGDDNVVELLRVENETLGNAEPRQRHCDLYAKLTESQEQLQNLAKCQVELDELRMQLEIETLKCQGYESEIATLKRCDVVSLSTCKELVKHFENPKETVDIAINEQHQQQIEKYKRKIQDLNHRIKCLVVKMDELKDQNVQLQSCLNAQQNEIESSTKERDSLLYSYNQQSTLVTDHLNELNNAIISSQIQVAKLTQARIACPNCSSFNAIGTMVDLDTPGDELFGTCPSCHSVVITS